MGMITDDYWLSTGPLYYQSPLPSSKFQPCPIINHNVQFAPNAWLNYDDLVEVHGFLPLTAVSK